MEIPPKSGTLISSGDSSGGLRPSAWLVGLALGSAHVAILWWLDPLARTEFSALVLSAAAAVYAGASLTAKTLMPKLVEAGVFLVFFGIACLGLYWSSDWLPAGYFLHGLWDLHHHRDRLAGRFYPPACLAYDWLVAVALLLSSLLFVD